MMLAGACHCGNLSLRFETALDPAAFPLRACQCSFCRSHGVVSTSDPAGRVSVRAEDGSLVHCYRFGLGITDFLVCRRCGVYVLALAEMEGACYAVLNANVLAQRAGMRGPVYPMDYDAETVEIRRARRKARWTPVRELDGL